MSEGPAPRRVVLHVGLHKTGTTYLQNLLRANRETLAREAGVFVPAGARKTVFASFDLIPWDRAAGRDRRVAGAWDRLAAEVNACGLPTAVVSEERLDVANPRQARRAVASFPGSEVHVVVTVRDLARVVVSHWQEGVKNGSGWTLEGFLDRLADPKAAATQPARGFWLHEDVTAVLRTWSSAVPVECVHVVTVPPPGSPPKTLAVRVGTVAGFGARHVPVEPPWANENAGAVGTELVRRLNERLGGAVDRGLYKRAVAAPVSRRLAAMPGPGAPQLDANRRAWAAETSRRFVEEIRAAGYDVVGDLDDLLREPAEQPAPAVVDDRALLDAALEALAELAVRHSAAVAKRERAAAQRRPDLAGALPQARAHLRSRAFAATRGLADLAGRTRVGRYAGAVYLRRRAGR
jgi:hypothetical protein